MNKNLNRKYEIWIENINRNMNRYDWIGMMWLDVIELDIFDEIGLDIWWDWIEHGGIVYDEIGMMGLDWT